MATAAEMVRVECERGRHWPAPSAGAARVALAFGLRLDEPGAYRLGPIDVPLGPRRIALFVGPSGSGKSSALTAIAAKHPGAVVAQKVAFPSDACLLDAVDPHHPLAETLALLAACGLGEAPLWLRAYEELSEGEKFRARLARAIAAQKSLRGGAAPIIVDEFCSGLHRRCAKAIAFNLRKLATRRGLCLVLATTSDDLLADLQPDTLVQLESGGRAQLTPREALVKPVSFRDRLRIERGSRADYDAFAAMHYRSGGELGFVDKVFVLRDTAVGEALGVVVYSHGPIELALRNQATGGIFVRNPARLNRELRILRRLVIHPDVRGCGLGHELVRRTLPQVGTPYVECLAAMGRVNPVFERAGMRTIGICSAPKTQQQVLEQLQQRGIDPTAGEFIDHVCRSRWVRKLVGQCVFDWYRATTGGGKSRVIHQSPRTLANLFRGLIASRPVYYLWRRDDAPTADRDDTE